MEHVQAAPRVRANIRFATARADAFDFAGFRVSAREWAIAGVIAVSVALFLFLPYALGHAFARADTAYTGILVNVEDADYLATIGQGSAGAWFYHTPFTSEPHASAFIQVFYLALGHLAAGLQLSSLAMWHLARVVADAVLFVVTFGFISFFVQAPNARRAAFGLALLGAGFDWGWLPFEAQDYLSAAPIDLRMPEAHLFFSALTYPHYAVGITLLLVVFWLMLRAFSHNLGDAERVDYGAGAAVANFALVLVFPFLILLPGAVLGAYYLLLMARARKILWREALALALAFAPTLPLLLYYQNILATNAVFRIWNAQATTLSPNILHYVLGYAPYLILGGLTFRLFKQWAPNRALALALVWIWIVVASVLLYAPLGAQRRFVEGLQVPCAILAALGLYEIVLPWLGKTRGVRALARRPGYSVAGVLNLFVVILIALTSLASVYVYVCSSVTLTFAQPYPLFRPRAELAAMDWLRTNTSHGAVVLSSYWSGSYIPARTGNAVFVGHRYETAHFEAKRAWAEEFFDGATDEARRRALLNENHIAYVFWGRDERAQGAFDPNTRGYLRRVFENSEVSVYEVVRN